jgi:hypothetical protein
MGAMFPRFKFENVTQIAGSSGGLLYMIATMTFIALILSLEALPFYFYLSFHYRGSPGMGTVAVATGAAVAGMIGLNLAAIFVPMRLGKRRLASLEL